MNLFEKSHIIVTGGLGFIGSNFVEMLLREYPQVHVTVLDAFTYAADRKFARALLATERVRVEHGRVEHVEDVAPLFRHNHTVAVVNFAAETHVDRSLSGASRFVRSNVEGVVVLLEEVLKRPGVRFLQVSTDEVYGSLLPGAAPFTEDSPLHPNNPYAVSKAAADLMVLSYAHSFGLDAVITRSSNNFGPRQNPEKFIPMCIRKVKAGGRCPIYGDGKQVRDWLFVEDNCRGILAALLHGPCGQVYNLGGRNERENLDVARLILQALGKPTDLLEQVPDRPGHDRRYGVDCTKAERELWWKRMPISFEELIRHTVGWYGTNQ